MKKTAMLELIEYLQTNHSINKDENYKKAIEQCLFTATNLLETEREQIIEAVVETEKDAVNIVNKALRLLNIKDFFQIDKMVGERYYIKNYTNEDI